MNDVADRLDAALAGQPGGDADLIPLLRSLDALEPLRRIPPRSPDSERRGLQTFLAQASALRPTVSARPASRHTGWRFKFKKETSPMNVLLILSLVVGLALGGTGAAAYAAQGSLPTETLYTVKLATEDVRLGLVSDSQAQLNLLLEMAQTRTTEMMALAARGESIPESVPIRLQTHLEAALQVAAQLGEPEMATALEQIRATVEMQAQAMLRAQQNAPDDSGLHLGQQTLTQTREMAELGLNDPALFRNRLNQNRPEAAPTQPEMMPGAGNGNGPQPSRTQRPSVTPQPGSGNGNSPGYQASGTLPPALTPQSTPAGSGNGHGPGPEATTCAVCTPEYDGNSYGPGPGNLPTTPQGNNYGAGLDPTGTCAPEYDGNSHGPGPGNPAVTPGGDNNSYGPGPQLPATLAPPSTSQPGNGPKP